MKYLLLVEWDVSGYNIYLHVHGSFVFRYRKGPPLLENIDAYSENHKTMNTTKLINISGMSIVFQKEYKSDTRWLNHKP